MYAKMNESMYMVGKVTDLKKRFEIPGPQSLSHIG